MPLDLVPPGSASGDSPHIINVPLQQEFGDAYITYSMSVIVSRALPDARDGLKPVHRRILYAALQGGYTSDKAYRKAARIVGDVMGQYHPHGDSSIYDAMVRMQQPFSMRVPLIDGQGNFGSVDGDPPAAMRYTEARLSRAGETLLRNIDKDTVDFAPNYDGSLQEPSVLPVLHPNLLINGSSGIAVGMASNIPPHNPVEAINAQIALVRNPDASLDDLLQIVQGPDFPTGAIAMGRAAMRQAYETGRGSITVRGIAGIEPANPKKPDGRQVIAITELPFQVNKAKLAERIGELAENGDQGGIPGIADVRDESDREGMRLVVELKKDADPNAVLASLYRMTDLQVSFSCNMVAIDSSSGTRQPATLGLKQMLMISTAHARLVIRRRSLNELEKARAKLHLQVGLLAALDELDKVIATIRASKDQTEARAALMLLTFMVDGLLAEVVDLDPASETEAAANSETPLLSARILRLTETQARAILDTRLARLTALDRNEIAAEAKTLSRLIEELLRILNDEGRADEVLIEELTQIRDNLPGHIQARRTQILEHGPEAQDTLATVPREDVLVTITSGGYAKRVSVSAFRTQRRGGTGKAGAKPGKDEAVMVTLPATTHAQLLAFTAKGMVYAVPVHRLPAANPADKGRPIVNFCEPLKGEEITAYLVREPDANEADSLIFVTSGGGVRRNAASDFARVKAQGKIAMKFEGDEANDRLIAVMPIGNDDDVLLATARGQAIRFHVEEVRVFQSRGSTGVRGVNLNNGDIVVGAAVLPHGSATPEERDLWTSGKTADLSDEKKAELEATERFLLTVSDRGFGKRTSTHEFRTAGRGGKGVTGAALTPETGKLIVALPVADDEDILITTTQGQMIRMKAAETAKQGRATRGTRLIRLDGDDRVASVIKLAAQQEEPSPGAEAAGK